MLYSALRRARDWQALTDAASRHGMSGLLYRHSAHSCPELVPQTILASWRERSVLVAKRSLRMQRQLLSLLARWEAAGIPVVPFKGPVFSQQLYCDSTVRQFVDLDVLVSEVNVAAARLTALDAGFTDVAPLAGVTKRTLHSAMQEIVLRHRDSQVLLEIHWREGPRFETVSLSAQSLIERCVCVELLGRQVRALSSPDVVLVLAVHAATHGWVRLEDVAAMAAAIRRLTPKEAAEVETLAAAHRCRRRLHVSVLLASAIAGCDLPRDIEVPARADRRAKDLAAAAGANLLWGIGETPAPISESPADKASRELRQARALDSTRAARRYLVQRLVTPAIHEWSKDEQPRRGSRGMVRMLLRRQRRLWRR